MFPTNRILLPRHLVSVYVALGRVCIFPNVTISIQKYSLYITVRRVNVMGKMKQYYGVVSNYNRTNYLKSRVILLSTVVFVINNYFCTPIALFEG